MRRGTQLSEDGRPREKCEGEVEDVAKGERECVCVYVIEVVVEVVFVVGMIIPHQSSWGLS